MTSVEVPHSIACALPSLAVVDITNEITHEVVASGLDSGIAYVAAEEPAVVRVNEREAGFFADLEELLGRLVPLETTERERLLALLLGPRTEQIPFADGRLCLGTWQRVLLFGFDGGPPAGWSVTILG